MTLQELLSVSKKIDVAFVLMEKEFGKDYDMGEVINSLAFCVAQMLHGIGLKEENIERACSAFGEDIKGYYLKIGKAIEKGEYPHYRT